ncbi:hypothetical protein G6L37_05330 [Agrobacterium rubi]|nr:hypothetical protein [Agrobacterium rubi]NTF24779.1 hypothetical protein [Agrobacterium rubi]
MIRFKDRNDTECLLQKSSLATEDAIWLGAAEIGLQHFKAGTGWRNVDLPETMAEHYSANNRMHLTQDQVRRLLPYLQKFADTGEL